MKVAVIGAGVTGLATAKVLAAKGHALTIFEQRGALGGVWEASRRYAGLKIQSPREIYVFSDFDMPASYPEFPSSAEVARHLDAYADKFALKPLIRFHTRVAELRRRADGSRGWTVDLRRADGGALPPEDFDHIVVCTGLFTTPVKFDIPGQREFESAGGRLIHSVEFTDPSIAAGKDVAVVGFGKSALDLAYEARKVARHVTVVCRRTLWHMPYSLFGILPVKSMAYSRSAEFWFGRRQTGFEGFLHRYAPFLVRLYWSASAFVIARHLGLRGPKMKPPLPLRNSVGLTTGFGFTDNLRLLRNGEIAVAKGEITHVSPQGAALDSGDRIPAQLVVLGTGFAQDISMLSPEHRARVMTPSGDYRLYRHIVAPGLPDLTFNGYNGTTAVPLTSEVAAHWIARWLDGRIASPGETAMNAVIDEDIAWRRKNLRGSPHHGHFAAPLNFGYLDTLLADMGLPPADSRYSAMHRFNAMLRPADYAFLNEID